MMASLRIMEINYIYFLQGQYSWSVGFCWWSKMFGVKSRCVNHAG